MGNIFRKKDAYIDRVNRSTFDLSFVNNLTMKFGAITPVCLLPASFGDSFQINARFNLQLLPTVFPIQTQLYVRLHFVYVRTRTLWEDWMAFFGGDETVTPPWMDPTAEDTPQGHMQFNIADDLQTGTLADYLGIPTTITGTYGGSTLAARTIDFFDFKDKVPALNSSLAGSPVVNNLSHLSLSCTSFRLMLRLLELHTFIFRDFFQNLYYELRKYWLLRLYSSSLYVCTVYCQV